MLQTELYGASALELLNTGGHWRTLEDTACGIVEQAHLLVVH
jgi:hypothetical protein